MRKAFTALMILSLQVIYYDIHVIYLHTQQISSNTVTVIHSYVLVSIESTKDFSYDDD